MSGRKELWISCNIFNPIFIVPRRSIPRRQTDISESHPYPGRLIKTCQVESSFNSTLVQLKVGINRTQPRSHIRFQFYLSSIKSCNRCTNPLPLPWFQFYLSSIKREPTKPSNGNQSCFNSTLVQLKASSAGGTALVKMCFNSTLVQLKG